MTGAERIFAHAYVPARALVMLGQHGDTFVLQQSVCGIAYALA